MKTLQERTKHLLATVGVKELAAATGISAPQLYRYAKGAPIPSDKLAKLTSHTGLSADWLLHGTHGAGASLERQGQLFSRVLSALQYQYTGPAFNPVTLSKALQLFWVNEEYMRAQGHLEPLDDDDILYSLYYIAIHNQNETLDLYLKTAKMMLESPSLRLEENWAYPFCDAVDNALVKYFESKATALYFNRTNGVLDKNHKGFMEDFVACIPRQAQTKAKILDVGCGAGRHIGFLYRNYQDKFELTGLDPSSVAAKLYQENIESQQVPPNSFFYGSFNDFVSQYSSEFDAILSLSVIHAIPYVADTNRFGCGRFFEDVRACLKPRGVAYIICRAGYGKQFLPIYIEEHHEHIQNLAQQADLRLHKNFLSRAVEEGMPGTEIGKGFHGYQQLLLVKPSK